MNKRIYRYRTAREIAKGTKVASCKLNINTTTYVASPAKVTLGGTISTAEGRLWRRFIDGGTLDLSAPATTTKTVYIEDESGGVHEATARKLTFVDVTFPYPRNYRKRVNMWKWLKQQETIGNFYIAEAGVDTDKCYVYYYTTTADSTTTPCFGVFTELLEEYPSTEFSVDATAADASLTVTVTDARTSPATTNTDTYKYRYCTLSGTTTTWSAATSATLSSSQFTLSGLTNGTEYVVEVTVYDASGTPIACSYAKGTPAAAPATPA